ncbi:MAG: DEAD/DEAH box helicase family protein [Nanoarchaeota archaeon]|nr:DEAD/DEAH box helicase family protein [Nanoarchaeota archaeon]MBU1269631.1 DEAD/DEAH box helicase family protein [Nanoarchaeota archaeon]MBU1603717.1 DEAD/DEAH box helicase family protein [Nanoarchaeota archaeon]MBU2442741.1 DEAD/DEAH box helicase family protein [Nanoarchaeota archaeon]
MPEYGKDEYITHKNIKEKIILSKQFQTDIAKSAISVNTAVILPTGLGKTIIAFLVIAQILPKKILFLAPTKPLVMQHYESCKMFLKIDENKIVMLSGSISPKKRRKLFEEATIVISTPQTIKNDLENELYNLDNFDLVIFDEMHKAVEKYAYVEIAKRFNKLILGLTASPGSRKKKINQIFENLKIKNVESRIRDDIDVKDHIKDIKLDWIKVPMNEDLRKVQKPLHDLFLEKVAKLNKLGILTYKKPDYISIKDILGARMSIKKRFGRSPYAFATYNNQAVLLQSYHCLELIETQGIESFLKYIEKFKEKKKLSRSEQMFLKHDLLKKGIELAKKDISLSHPKLNVLKKIVEDQFKKEEDSIILIFTQYRNTIDSIENTIKVIPQSKIHRFVGQAKQGTVKGMNQKEQKEIIDKFKEREINILIATSVAEEGINIPNVNRVIFYEPVPSEIRGIQRKGRTGRSHIGEVTILITEGTRDEAYFYASTHKEKKMQNIVKGMR